METVIRESLGTRPPEKMPADTRIMKTLGPYEILQQIGRGGMGVVYKALHPGLKRTVALKVLIAGEDASEEAITRFHREAESVAKLGHHPNIVPVYDIGREGKLHYFAMHFVDGKSLDRQIDDGQISPKRAAVITMKIAEALQHAHDQGILHRDIKPANILLTKEGVPQLTDFGLAKDVASQSKMTQSGMTLGTPQYMPPEQADGRLKRITEKSDVYSLGASLYEMLTCEPPFEGATAVEVLHKVLLKEPAPVSKINPKVDRDLNTICMKCLEKDPLRRFPTASALSADLERFLQGNPITARPPSLNYLLWKKVRRHRSLVITALTALLLLITGGVIAGILLSIRGAQTKAQATRADKAEARGDEELRLRQKNQGVARVLLAAQAKLFRAHSILKASYYNSVISAEDREALYAKHHQQIDALFEPFLRPSGADSAERAMALALKGWFVRLRWDRERSLALFREAREADPQVGWGFLFEAMVWLTQYLLARPLPPCIEGMDTLEFGEVPPETDRVRIAREKFTGILDRLGNEGEGRGGEEIPVWGAGLSEGFLSSLSALRRIRVTDLRSAEQGISQLLPLPEFFWMEEELYFARAGIRYALKDFAGGLKDVSVFLERCPDLAHALLLKGNLTNGLALQKKNAGQDPVPLFLEAIETYGEARKRDPERADICNARGKAFLALAKARASRGEDPQGTYEKALADFREGMHLEPEQAQLYGNMGIAYMNLGDLAVFRGEDPREAYGKALENYNKSLDLAPASRIPRINRGNLYENMGALETAKGGDPGDWHRKALEDFTEVLRNDPNHPGALYSRGTLYVTLGDREAARRGDFRVFYEKAVADLEAVVRMRPHYSAGYLSLGNVFQSLGDAEKGEGADPRSAYRRAIDQFTRVLEKDPNFAEAYNNRGIVLWRFGLAEANANRDPRETYRKAIKDLDKALDANPAFWKANLNRGLVYNAMSKAEKARGGDPIPPLLKAISDLDLSLLGNPESVEGHLNRGLVHATLGDTQMGRGIDPRDAFRKAIEDYENALRRNPKCAAALEGRGSVHSRLGDVTLALGGNPSIHFTRAIADLEASIQLNPKDWVAYANRGVLLEKLGRFHDAVESYRKAIALTGDGVPQLKQYLARAKDRADALPAWTRSLAKADALMRAGKTVEASEAYMQALDAAGKAGGAFEGHARILLAEGYYHCACALSKRYGQSDGDERDPDLAAKAVENLRKALDLGGTNLDRLRNDPFLDPLRSLPAFEALQKEGDGD
jgi:tetratricopeptide (TPR) repeat protein